jgi:hypothetical protein
MQRHSRQTTYTRCQLGMYCQCGSLSRPKWVQLASSGAAMLVHSLRIICSCKLPPTGRPSIASTAKLGALVTIKALALPHSVGHWHLTVGGVAGAIVAFGPRGARLAR